ncbi:MAG: hypothetical protein WCF67_04960 [Chitinophagaceae bacterium]
MNKQKQPAKKRIASPSTDLEPLSESINTFFAAFQLQECQTQIWNLAIGYIESPHSDGANAIDKSNTLHFCKGIDLLLRMLHTYKINNFQSLG